MPQKPLASAVLAQNPAGALTLEQVDALSNLKVTNVGDTSLSLSGPVSVAKQLTTAAGTLRSAENLNATELVAALTTAQVGYFYDVLVTSGISNLSTTQVAALSTSNIAALCVTTVADQSYGGNNGIPISNGLVFVPATAGQTVNVLKK